MRVGMLLNRLFQDVVWESILAQNILSLVVARLMEISYWKTTAD
jgi:hypothetical protein